MADPETYFEMSARERATDAPLVVEVEGLEELQKALKDFGDKWKEIATEALGRGMAMLSSEAKQLAPVDTGRLMSSIGEATPPPPARAGDGIWEIKREGSQIVGKIGSRVEYAAFQEYGTRYQSGKPYLAPALARNTEKAVKMFEQDIEDALKRHNLK